MPRINRSFAIVLLLAVSMAGCDVSCTSPEDEKKDKADEFEREFGFRPDESPQPIPSGAVTRYYDSGDDEAIPDGATMVDPPQEPVPLPEDIVVESGPAESVPGPRTSFRIAATGDAPPHEGFGTIDSTPLVWASEGGVAIAGATRASRRTEETAGNTVRYVIDDSFTMRLDVADDRTVTGSIKGRTKGRITNVTIGWKNRIDWTWNGTVTGRFTGSDDCDEVELAVTGTLIRRQYPDGKLETERVPIDWEITGAATSGAVVEGC